MYGMNRSSPHPPPRVLTACCDSSRTPKKAPHSHRPRDSYRTKAPRGNPKERNPGDRTWRAAILGSYDTNDNYPHSPPRDRPAIRDSSSRMRIARRIHRCRDSCRTRGPYANWLKQNPSDRCWRVSRPAPYDINRSYPRLQPRGSAANRGRLRTFSGFHRIDR